MSAFPRTPSRPRARSEVKTPLTPSLISALNNASINSPSKPQKSSKLPTTVSGDLTNPFISSSQSRSRPPSPVKRPTSGAFPASLRHQASSGVLRKGGIETKFDVVTNDYVPPPKTELKRSRSTPGTSRSNANVGDRFITTREETDLTTSLDMMNINPQSSSPGHTARLIAATGVPVNKRILSYHEPPPAASSNKSLSQQRELAKPLLHTRSGSLPSSNGVVKSRKIATEPERILEAPDLVDDFYLNVVSWSCLNMVSVALHDQLYIWNGDSGTVNLFGQAPSGGYISSVDFSNDGAFVGVGLDSGDVQLWDIESARKLRTMSGHRGQVATLSWNQHILTSGCGDGSIWHHDVRVARHKVMELIGHTGEVCGLKWRADGEMLASGGNDNVVNIWDGRMDEALTAEGNPEMRAKWTKRNHTAAVKAIAWCPWQPSLLATGGGTNDASIHIWNSSTGARLHTLKTPAQVTTIQWSPHRKEFMSTHGYPTNAIMVHAYPSLENVAEIRDAHEARVLFSALGPAGDVVVTGAGDEYLKFWRIWEVEKKKKKEVKSSVGLTNTTSSRVLALR